MEKLKVLTVFGTRPEAHKMAPVIKALEQNKNIEPRVCVTAQHREMLDAGLKAFGIRPDIDLNLMKHRQSLTDVMTGVLEGFGRVLDEEKPDLCLVHGDTLTTFAASVACFFRGVNVGHVEAGLRTGDKYAPYPEELNRRLTGVLADLHFAPTLHAKQNLLKENIPEVSIFVTGNTALDAIKYTARGDHAFANEILNGVDYGATRMILLTAHRSENLGAGMENICRAVLRITEAYPDVTVVYPVHLNPRVRETVYKFLGSRERIILTEPVDIVDCHNLIMRSYMVMTDSGGLQEEAPYFDKPVIVLREVTERPEGVATGALRIAGVKEDNIFDYASELLEDAAAYKKMANAKNPFGDGNASERIIGSILYYYGLAENRPPDFI